SLRQTGVCRPGVLLATGQRSYDYHATFRDRADWQFVESILEAMMRERMKYERQWIMTASTSSKQTKNCPRRSINCADACAELHPAKSARVAGSIPAPGANYDDSSRRLPRWGSFWTSISAKARSKWWWIATPMGVLIADFPATQDG